ncbi:hypothetical protein [Chitinophaga vietnamensis]|uniref:hypothetical protein n=1 Tax=Chitinophaga vietnamensis TaxID=2593957 RepID=UPI0011787FB8|nr:hypothetical protein [Chitinophaga vietnamensis]
MHKTVTHGVACAMLLASVTFMSSFKNDDGTSGTYLKKISSASGQTTLEYNSDKTIRKIVQHHKTENASYTDVTLPVYENGHLVKTMLADDENASSGDLYAAYDYVQGSDKIAKVSFYRDNAVYTYDSLAYDANGRLAFRYQFSKVPGKGAWENSGYQQFTWNDKGDVERMDNYGKQPGYSKFVNTSSINYTYDDRQNPQLQQPALAFVLDANAANLSAHNILSENLSTPHSSRVITNTYVYTYAGRYPVRATYNSGADQGIVKLEWAKL